MRACTASISRETHRARSSRSDLSCFTVFLAIFSPRPLSYPVPTSAAPAQTLNAVSTLYRARQLVHRTRQAVPRSCAPRSAPPPKRAPSTLVCAANLPAPHRAPDRATAGLLRPMARTHTAAPRSDRRRPRRAHLVEHTSSSTPRRADTCSPARPSVGCHDGLCVGGVGLCA